MGTLTVFGIRWKADKSNSSEGGRFFNIKLTFNSRDVIFTSHVPWLGSIYFALPGFANNFKAFRVRARHWARRRIKEGSTQKDLFYHLVRLHPQISA